MTSRLILSSPKSLNNAFIKSFQRNEFGSQLASRHQSTASATERDVNNETAKFRGFADDWWNLDGPLRPLHSLNRLRVPLIRDAFCSSNNEVVNAPNRKSKLPLAGAAICDVGCGGGILSEPLARLGASVTGIDLVHEGIVVAKRHAAAQTDFDAAAAPVYHCQSVDALAEENPEKFHVVVASEVLEHVDDLDLTIAALVKLTRSGGHLVFTTINRTALSYVAAIALAEWVFGVVPRGTHEWRKFVSPSQLESVLHRYGVVVRKRLGMAYNPIADTWCWSQVDAVNYAIVAQKTETE